MVESKRKFFEKKAQSDFGCQSKGGFSSPNEVKRVQGVSEGGAGRSVTKQVNDACKHIQQSLANLVEGIQFFKEISLGPMEAEVQIGRKGALRKEGSFNGPEEGCKKGGETEDRGREGSTASSSAPVTSSRPKKEDNYVHQGVMITQGSDTGIHPCHATRQYSAGAGSSMGSSNSHHSDNTCPRKEGIEEGFEEGAEKSMPGADEKEGTGKIPLEVRRLGELRQMEALTTHPKWRSKGGVGNLHHGVTSSSRLSKCSFAESVNDIVQCNNHLKLEDDTAESVRIWEFGQNLGMECLGDEGSVAGELGRMEIRDNEVNKVSWGGRRKCVP